MAELSTADQGAISKAIWSHPQGVSYTTKLTQIASCCQQMGNKHSGETRLWMYQLYAESIQADLDKKQLIEKEQLKRATKPAHSRIRRRIRRLRQHQELLEEPVGYKPLPHYAPAFVFPPKTFDVEQFIALLDPLPVLGEKTVAASIKFRQKRKRKQEQDLLLLLAV